MRASNKGRAAKANATIVEENAAAALEKLAQAKLKVAESKERVKSATERTKVYNKVEKAAAQKTLDKESAVLGTAKQEVTVSAREVEQARKAVAAARTAAREAARTTAAAASAAEEVKQVEAKAAETFELEESSVKDETKKVHQATLAKIEEIRKTKKGKELDDQLAKLNTSKDVTQKELSELENFLKKMRV